MFQNQYNLRVSNQLKTISLLRKGEIYLSDIADFLNVSHAATTKIINQLCEAKVVNKKTNVPEGKLERGRLPITISLNEDVGVTCAIAFAKKIEIAISSLSGKILLYDSYEISSFITEKDFEKVANIIEEFLKRKEVNGRPLLGICISSPGMVQKETGDIFYSFKIKTDNGCSPLTYFKNKFGVTTNLYNDVQIGMVGAKKYDLIPNDAFNYMFARIDTSCCVAFSFDGKLYQGHHGYPGEQTFIFADDEFTNASTCNILYGFSSIAKIANRIDPSVNYLDEYDIPYKSKIIELYKKNDEVIVKAAKETAIKNAIQLIAYNDLLNLDHIIIDGGINNLGEKYKEILLNSIYKYRKNFNTNIIFLNSEINTSLLGAIYQSGNIYFLDKLEKITNQRSSTGNYNIADAFGDNI